MMETNYFIGVGPPNLGSLNLGRIEAFIILASKENSENKIARLTELYQDQDDKLHLKTIRKFLVNVF